MMHVAFLMATMRVLRGLKDSDLERVPFVLLLAMPFAIITVFACARLARVRRERLQKPPVADRNVEV
jgi:hypothetical protein